MGGHVIALMHLLRLEDAAQSAVAASEFNAYKVHPLATAIIVFYLLS